MNIAFISPGYREGFRQAIEDDMQGIFIDIDTAKALQGDWMGEDHERFWPPDFWAGYCAYLEAKAAPNPYARIHTGITHLHFDAGKTFLWCFIIGAVSFFAAAMKGCQ